jgi:hypothetical protein
MNDSQRYRILELLEARANDWVPMYELALRATPTGIGCAVHSRINDLRRRNGLNISNKKQTINGLCHSFYRLNKENSAQ